MELFSISIQSFQRWNTIATSIAQLLTILSAFVLFVYFLRLISIRRPKKKFDFINKYEINTLISCGFILILAGIFKANSYVNELNILWLFVRVFLAISLGLIFGVIIRTLFIFYYPFYIEKRLKRLRYKPRISPKTGNEMVLLSEEEEDVYLDEGMQAEEEIFSIDYDVWKDEETGYIKIEKYSGHLHAKKCPECNYQTFRVTKEELLKSPTDVEEGELRKSFECGYCGYKTKIEYKVAVLKNIYNSQNAEESKTSDQETTLNSNKKEENINDNLSD